MERVDARAGVATGREGLTHAHLASSPTSECTTLWFLLKV